MKDYTLVDLYLDKRFSDYEKLSIMYSHKDIFFSEYSILKFIYIIMAGKAIIEIIKEVYKK